MQGVHAPARIATALPLVGRGHALPARLDLRASTGPGSAAADWARSGAMALTGEPDGPPLPAPAGFATVLVQAVDRLAALAGDAGKALRALDAAALLGERAAALGSKRRGRTSAGGSCRLLTTATLPIALQLARESDEQLLEAWLETPIEAQPVWPSVQRVVSTRRADELVERGRLLGLAVAAAGPPPATPPPWLQVRPIGARVARTPSEAPRIVDLSSLWAGPLCGHLLGLAGAQVIKVESTRRPDGARRGPVDFFDLLNAGKACVALDFESAADRCALRALISSADVVIEASRPRALQQLGIDAAQCVRERPGTSWISLTGYGRSQPEANWIAFGDDAAVAAGTTAALRVQTGCEVFCADALADPLTGAHAALAGLASYRAGGGHLLELSLRDVTAAITVDAALDPETSASTLAAAAPRMRRADCAASPLGVDTADVLAGLPC